MVRVGVRRAQDDQPPVKEVGPYPSALFLHDGAGPGLLRAIIARREDYLGANFAEPFAARVATLAPFGPGCFSTTPTSKSIPTVRACVCKPHAAVTPRRRRKRLVVGALLFGPLCRILFARAWGI